jgi:iron(III) transport system substrate-binding protein
MKQLHSLLSMLVLLGLMILPLNGWADEFVVYSTRSEQLLGPLLEAYTNETDIKIDLITDKFETLLHRLKTEGKDTRADLLITVDAGDLWHATRAGVLQSINSTTLKENIPKAYSDPSLHWFGLSLRARAIVYSTERVKPEELSTYEALGRLKWRGRLLLSTSDKIYNQSLVAMLIAEHGETITEEFISSWVANLAKEPFPTDTMVMEAILAKQGDVGIVNTYYFGRLLKKNPNLKLALYWPNQETGGCHVNISGAGVTRHSKHPEAAIKFLEWLSSSKAQNLFADVNMEYPVNPKVAAHPSVAGWGVFKASQQNLVIAGLLQDAAIRLMARADYL